MKILVVNAGSSSLKYQLIDMEGEKELAKGLVERIGIEGSRLKQTAGPGPRRARSSRSSSALRIMWKPPR